MSRFWICCVSVMLFAVGSCASEELDFAAIDPVAELRAVWLNADAIPRTSEQTSLLFDGYRTANINAIFPEIVCRGYAVYDSKLLARDPRFAGTADPLPILIKSAHERGIEVHPWVWVFRAGYTKDRGAILTAHPDWTELNKFGEDLSANGGLWISPAVSEATEFLSDLFAELVTKYDIDGIHLDYVRYETQSPTPYGYGPRSRELFKRLYGRDPLEIDRLSPEQADWHLFRERLVDAFVQRIALQTRFLKPQVKISAAVGSDIRFSRLTLLQNWENWIANKWVDFLTPMAYADSEDKFDKMVGGLQLSVIGRTFAAPGIGLHLPLVTPVETIKQIGIARRNLMAGVGLFAAQYMSSAHLAGLAKGPYLRPALIPFRNPKGCVDILNERSAKLAADSPVYADYLARYSKSLAQAADYSNADTPYVPQSDPKLNIPDNILPLPTVDIQRTMCPIVVDGLLNEPAWKLAAAVDLMLTTDAARAPTSTSVRLLYDDQNLYIAFECHEDDLASVKQEVTKRDGPTFYDDSVEVFLDPSAKRRSYFHLSTNMLGTHFDQRVYDVGWNADWQTASKFVSMGWVTEFAIPFSSLGLHTPTTGTTWALNFTRNKPGQPYMNWSVVYGSYHSPDRFGVAVFR